MEYEIDGTPILVPINRTQVVDITVGDKIIVRGLEGAEYTWTHQDGELVENNPDDELFLEIERTGKAYRASGIILQSNKIA